jgi:phosphoribosyl 1,2-cyclic phosphodiesterase
MRVTFWGVRGSIAVSGEDFLQTGGHTTCVELEHEGQKLIIDGGTGLKRLGDSLKGMPLDATLLFTHVHWDHIQGLPFFSPAFHPASSIKIVGVSRSGWHFKEILSLQMTPPTFPVPLAVLQGIKSYDDYPADGTLKIGPFTITALDQKHPDGIVVYLVEAGGKKVLFATDVEHGGESIDPQLVALAQDCDLLIHDAQYLEDEYYGKKGPSRKGWGHCMWTEAVRLAQMANVKKLALFHHDPNRNDAAVNEIENQAQQIFKNSFAARENHIIEV